MGRAEQLTALICRELDCEPSAVKEWELAIATAAHRAGQIEALEFAVACLDGDVELIHPSPYATIRARMFELRKEDGGDDG